MDFHGFSGYPVFREAHLQLLTDVDYYSETLPSSTRPSEGNKTKFAGQKWSQNSKSHSYGLEKNVLISPPKKMGITSHGQSHLWRFHIQQLDPIECPRIMGVYPMAFLLL